MGLFRKKPTELAPPPMPVASMVDATATVAGPQAATIVATDTTSSDIVTEVDLSSDVDVLRTELAVLRQRLDASDREKAELASIVEALNERLIPTPPPAEPIPTTSSENRLDVERQLARIDKRLDALDGRVTSVSTELAGQLTELGNDIEPMQQSAERLAAEQARYQIAFRQDLADLAERLRRPSSH